MSIFSKNISILVDIGGSGARIAPYSNGQIGTIRKCSINSRETLFAEIRRTIGDNKVGNIAFSVAGFVNADKGVVLQSSNLPYLEGNLAEKAKITFNANKVRLVNDGEAHARSLFFQNNIRFGAIHLALGTAVAFGVINEKRKIVQTASGENWDIGRMVMNTRSNYKEVWQLLGTEGLKELERDLPDDCYKHYGRRLGTLLSQLAVIFRPYTIGLSGGIVNAHANDLNIGIMDTFREPAFSQNTEIRLIKEPDTVMLGLTTLL
ncbi:MAG: hypothetical protein IJ874_08350 [Ruminococcus sp.]|nr:hypothetical protein [Ruminococcus sp.]